MRKLEKPPNINDPELMFEMLAFFRDPASQRLVSQLNNKYIYWDKVRYQPVQEGFTQAHLWAAIKMSRTIEAKVVRFGRKKFFYNLTDTIQRGLHEFDMHMGGNLGSRGLIPEEDKKRYLISSIMEEAIASSQIEGAVTSRKVARQMLLDESKPRNKSEQMILNNFITIKPIVDIKNEPITIERLLHIHQLISNKTLDNESDEGRFRDHDDIHVVDVTDGEIVFTPPAHGEVEEMMRALIDFFNEDDHTTFIHPIIKGCIIHFIMGFIHPFVDGNGRTARALFYWYLLKKGYWLTEYLSISRLIIRSKQQYAMSFLYCETDENDLTYFLNYKIKMMQLAYAHLQDYIKKQIHEKKQLVDFQRIGGVNNRQAQILLWLYVDSNEIFKVNTIENRFGVSNQTARTDLYGLVELGFMEELTINKKERAFIRSASFLDRMGENSDVL
ncbi:MAG TPA: Fic family protein [Chitinophagales bacterium]|nr:Fic family protein [Chitinophagales bacterium]